MIKSMNGLGFFFFASGVAGIWVLSVTSLLRNKMCGKYTATNKKGRHLGKAAARA